ncbi:hypothetical protein NXS19_005412 [Fusarium pseudograminearum]|nr:hypothetical protein NXS19_005412 [Fusarium pseudograminearum]
MTGTEQQKDGEKQFSIQPIKDEAKDKVSAFLQRSPRTRYAQGYASRRGYQGGAQDQDGGSEQEISM